LIVRLVFQLGLTTLTDHDRFLHRFVIVLVRLRQFGFIDHPSADETTHFAHGLPTFLTVNLANISAVAGQNPAGRAGGAPGTQTAGNPDCSGRKGTPQGLLFPVPWLVAESLREGRRVGGWVNRFGGMIQPVNLGKVL